MIVETGGDTEKTTYYERNSKRDGEIIIYSALVHIIGGEHFITPIKRMMYSINGKNEGLDRTFTGNNPEHDIHYVIKDIVNGISIDCNSEGNICHKTEMINGYMDGYNIYYGITEDYSYKHFYICGKREGEHKSYNGDILRFENYKCGRLNGKCIERYDNGNIRSKCYYKNNAKIGKEYMYYKNGQTYAIIKHFENFTEESLDYFTTKLLKYCKDEDYECLICRNKEKELIVLSCHHCVGRQCLSKWFFQSNQQCDQKCPYCNQLIDWKKTKRVKS